ncbi:helix-turn-helix domain-containing protein [Steroidobacter sp. S1-65]|uniref:Helix-turn-helix domain-containing protein n=1 Tax=Steroidobacter gossypii TaxID=2805490 RepID=A0ABS1WUG3_9GAMM|nr:RodZ domain-containing protein [Steroidobacter gossypii]MBM0104622.1 helix-turn-helix domain-containing protein [Steroidobacter gossypii]
MNAAGNSSEQNALDNAQVGSAEPTNDALTPGELLRRERERRSLSQLHIAEELHLDVRMVEAIETNRFDELGVPVYARGHLRQYATLLGLSPQLIIERYEAVTGRQEAPPPIPASATTSVAMQRPSLAGPLWLGVGLIALMLGWWIWATVATPGDPVQAALDEQFAAESQAQSEVASEPVTPPPSAVEASTPAPATTTTVPATTTAPPATTTTSPPAPVQPSRATNSPATSSPAPTSPAPGSAVAQSSQPANAPAADAVRLRLEFSDASWTEIYDATGKRLMFGLGESGRVRNVSGTPPIRITLGNASAVSVQVNGESVVVPRRAGKDSTRFVVAAGGAIEMSGTMTGEVSGE